ncbi:MAG: mannose-1-phosphate guanylyltransferase [Halobacteriovoraceae bacterium]|jgi:mannose-1-phosphate guanylyltransferase|nr:mannose-1-phosphate guanylyltransferase [Halobacteriovoraceae bacterium]
MSQYTLYGLVMAGGQGTRFWPESTSKKPKQYLSLVSEKSLLHASLSRFGDLIGTDKRYIVTVKMQESLAKECSEGEINPKNFIFEPAGRNTAPCILLALASLVAEGARDEDVVSIVTSDHVIKNTSGFQKTIEKASAAARSEGKIVTIGITPESPHTGFGYIKAGDGNTDGVFEVNQFVEKPDKVTAETYLADGNYFWNAGMFVSTIGTLKEEFNGHAPEMFTHFNSLVSAHGNDQRIAEVYDQIPAESIDYAVMEKSNKVMVVPAEFDWNDIGSWDALESVLPSEDGNTWVADNGHFQLDASGNIAFAPGMHVSLIGVEDLIVVSNGKSVVVLPKSRSQDIKKIVAQLKEQNSDLV